MIPPKSRALVALFVLSAVALGCRSRQGRVHVSHPEVFNRERLVSERLSSVQWLQEQYGAFDESRVDGFVDSRSDRSLQVSTEIGLQGAAGGVFPEDPSGSTLADLPSGLADELPSPGDLVRSDVRSNNIEALRDRIAYRETVASEIRRQMLDDAHDLPGHVLREMSFQIGVDPAPSESRRALVLMRVEDGDRFSTEQMEGLFQHLVYDESRPRTTTRLDEAIALVDRMTRNGGWLVEGEGVLRVELSVSDRNRLQQAFLQFSPRFAESVPSSFPAALSTPPLTAKLYGLLAQVLAKGQIEDWRLGDDATKEHLKSIGDLVALTWMSAELKRQIEGHDRTSKHGIPEPPEISTAVQAGEAALASARTDRMEATKRLRRANADVVGLRDRAGALGGGLAARWNALDERVSQVRDLAGSGAVRVFSVWGEDWPVGTGDDAAEVTPESKEAARELTDAVRAAEIAADDLVSASSEAAAASTSLLTSYRVLIAEYALYNQTLRRVHSEALLADSLAHPTYVTRVGPAGLHENIGIAAASREALSTLSSVGYSTGSVGVEAKSRLDAVEALRALSSDRNAVFLGLGDGSNQFGWLIGPPFSATASVGASSNRQVPLVQAATVRFVTHTLVKELKLRAVRVWLTSKGELCNDAGESVTWDSVQSALEGRRKSPRAGGPDPVWLDSEEMVIELPQDDLAIRGTLLGSIGTDTRPTIEAVSPATLEEGRAMQSILIQGSNLWRNPEVYLGGTPARRVDVTSDMSGLVAYFERLQAPGPTNIETSEVPLRVVTSSGGAVYKKNDVESRITIHRSAKPKPFVKGVADAFRFSGSPVSLMVETDALPKAYHALTLQVRPIGAAAWFSVTQVPERRPLPAGRTLLTFRPGKVVAQAGWPKDDPVRLEVGLLVQADPYGDPKRVPMSPPVNYVHFGSTAKGAPKISVAGPVAPKIRMLRSGPVEPNQTVRLDRATVETGIGVGPFTSAKRRLAAVVTAKVNGKSIGAVKVDLDVATGSRPLATLDAAKLTTLLQKAKVPATGELEVTLEVTASIEGSGKTTFPIAQKLTLVN